MLEMEDEEHERNMHGEEQQASTNAENFGFRPEKESEKDARSDDGEGSESEVEETPEILAIRAKIARLLSSYPSIKLRSTYAMMDQLRSLDLAELQNVYTNAIIDLEQVRGTPSAEALLTAICTPVDLYFPGYLQECMMDQDLKRDVEAEVINWLGEPGAKSNICFRLVNNAYNCYKRARGIDGAYQRPMRRDEAFERDFAVPLAAYNINNNSSTGQVYAQNKRKAIWTKNRQSAEKTRE